MGFFLETVFGGLMAGMLYALVALGFVLIFKASGVFNFAQGAMVLFAALAMARFSEWFPQWFGFESLILANVLALIASVACMIVVAWLVERLALRGLVNQPAITLLMATLGISYFLDGAGQLLFGSATYKIDMGLPKDPMFVLENTFPGGLLPNKEDLYSALIAALLVATLTLVASAQAANEQFIPLPVYRTGQFAPLGISWGDGKQDYLKLVNARDGGVNGVKLAFEECETAYDAAKGVECYERLKTKGGGASGFDTQSTGITFAVTDKAFVDKVVVETPGYGLSASADGSVFEWNFPLLGTYWTAADVMLQDIARKEGGSQAAYTSGGEQQMCAIGRALMADPKMVLLDEPSMGLAPQIVEEVFEIVRDLNRRERVTFLLAEQNTHIALRYADHGYILENGRVVMDGSADALRGNEDVQEFYLGMGREADGERTSFRDAKSYKRRKRWLA